ncbi:MAG TPA: type I 3-dehydroquinate dehydratase [Dissulfurispiraceae bacterium]
MDMYICNMKLGEKPLIAGILTDIDVPVVDGDYLNSADLLELRVDMFSDIALSHIVSVFKTVRERFRKPIIATVRDIREGGQREVEDRLTIYREVIPLSDIVDVELNAKEVFPVVKRLCRDRQKILIGSYHNFEQTPDDAFCDEVISKGKEAGADIVKLAARAQSKDDLMRLMLLNLRHRDKGMITISMGDSGLPSRVFSPLFGSLITYGYINHPSAPGQISVSELLYIFRRLKIRYK